MSALDPQTPCLTSAGWVDTFGSAFNRGRDYVKQMFNRWSLVPAVAALIIFIQTTGAFAQPANVEAAKKEGKIVVYGSVVPQAMEGLHQAFKKKYGIDVEYWRGSSTQVSERALTEWRAGKPGFDIAEGNRGVQLIMKNEGLFQKFIPPASEKFPAQYKEKDGLITPWRVLPISILYNTELVKAADLPKTFDDLLNPKWSGKISIPDPTRHTTTAQFLWNLRKIQRRQVAGLRKSLSQAETDPGRILGAGHDDGHQRRGSGRHHLHQVHQAIQRAGRLYSDGQIPDRSELSESQRQIGTAECGEALYRFRLFSRGTKRDR